MGNYYGFEGSWVTENSEVVMFRTLVAAQESTPVLEFPHFQELLSAVRSLVFLLIDVVIRLLGKHSLLNFCTHILFVGGLSGGKDFHQSFKVA